jgi:hypothetical protein
VVSGPLSPRLGDDFAILSDDERERMLTGLEGRRISLGDRSKVRHHFGTLLDGKAPERQRPCEFEDRRLQEDGAEANDSKSDSLSMDTCVATAYSMGLYA